MKLKLNGHNDSILCDGALSNCETDELASEPVSSGHRYTTGLTATTQLLE